MRPEGLSVFLPLSAFLMARAGTIGRGGSSPHPLPSLYLESKKVLVRKL